MSSIATLSGANRKNRGSAGYFCKSDNQWACAPCYETTSRRVIGFSHQASSETMICPRCKAEYREGFTVCADCEVQLVPSEAAFRTRSKPWFRGTERIRVRIENSDEDPFANLAGNDPRIHAELCLILEEERILTHHPARRSSLSFHGESA